MSLFIRPATIDDLPLCIDIDRSYETTETWQMEPRRGNGRLSINFQTLRLPHPLPVKYPYSRDQLHERWQNQVEAFFVMEKELRGQNENPLYGYVNVHMDRVDGIAWLGDLVVAPAYRRQGHGEHLLEIASQWGRTQQWGNGDNTAQGGIQRANRLMVTLQTKNNPAIQFYRKNGFSFRGYHETYFHTGDIALYFGVKLK